MGAIQEFIWATAAVLVLRAVFADARPAQYDHDTTDSDNSKDYSAETTKSPAATETAQPTFQTAAAEEANEDTGTLAVDRSGNRSLGHTLILTDNTPASPDGVDEWTIV